MKTITIDKTKLVAAYKAASPAQKAFAESILSKEELTTAGCLITSWEEVCEIKKLDPVESLPYPKTADKEQEALNAFFVLSKVREVLNTNAQGKLWEPDWTNSNEYKYWPYFTYAAGSGFSFIDAFHVTTFTAVGSRLVFKTRDLAEHAGNYFLKYYQALFTL